MEDAESLILQLFDVGAVKFGRFTLKSGIESPLYVDLRVTVSHPPVLEAVARLLSAVLEAAQCDYDVLCGVPYTALPFATVMSMRSGKPMVMRRKESKAYGLKRSVEGAYAAGQRCVVVEDLVTSGASILETVEALQTEGLQVHDAVALLDRQQGGSVNLSQRGVRLHTAFRMEDMLRVLVRASRIESMVAQSVMEFVGANRAVPVPVTVRRRWGATATHPVAQRLLAIRDAKQSNLCVAADLCDAADILRLCERIGPLICVLKMHADTVDNWTAETASALRAAADRHNFLLFEDRKFADIGHTVMCQASGGVHRIVAWADLINAHGIPGRGVVDGLRQACQASGRAVGLLLVAQMSSKGNLIDSAYTERCLAMAREARDLCIGFIAQERLDDSGALLVMTPGVQLAAGGDALGQQYNTPADVIGCRGADFIIVGRGIYGATDPCQAARAYQAAGWAALTDASSRAR